MNDLLEHMPIHEKETLVRAMELCPEQVTNVDKVRFLRRMEFDPKAAAQRYVACWDRRRELFGEDHWHLPLTLEGALQRDTVALARGVLHVLGKDVSGRGVVYYDPGRHDWNLYSVDSMLRAHWYFVETCSEQSDDGVDVVGIVNQRNESMANFSRKYCMHVLDIERRYLPVRISGIHGCHPNFFFGECIAPVLKFLMKKEWRLLFQIHRGLGREVVDKLTSFGIPRDIIPSSIGGDRNLDIASWLETRRSLHL